MYLTLCLANSAGVGIPCTAASKDFTGLKLGHPTRGDLQTYQDKIDNAADATAKAEEVENRVKHMESLKKQGYRMYWTMPPAHSSRYTVRSGDGLPADDPKEYIPGQWMNIYVHALDEGKKFTGLVMYAVDSNNQEVGEWKVTSAAFRYGAGADGVSCVTHRNAEFKHYYNVFRFKCPEKGTIKFNVLVKVGLAFPVLDGNFYWPNNEPLSLSQGSLVPQRWFEGSPGQSCDAVCTSVGMNCDLNILTSIGSDKSTFYSMAQRFSPSCVEPVMIGCGPHTPSVGTEGCFFHDPVCGETPTAAPAARKDPCEGLADFTAQEETFESMLCKKWDFERQSNPPGNQYNDMYEGKKVKICCQSTNQCPMKSQDRIGGNGMMIEGECAPPGGFTASPTPVPPPPRSRGAITCEASDSEIKDGGRLCACSCDSGNCVVRVSAAPTRAPTFTNGSTARPSSPAVPDDIMNFGTQISPNMALMSLCVLFGSVNQVSNRLLKLLSTLSLALSVNAHNWMSSPSRANNNFNAFQTAPCPPRGGRVHFQVKAGQKFPMEFATGHSTPARGGTYLTVLKAEDEVHMIKHTRALLDDYLESAPVTDTPYMAEHKSHHVGSTASSTTTTNVLADLTEKYAVGATSDNIRNFGPNWGNKPARGSAIYPKNPDDTKNDLRVKYTNDKYPWIISCHKFKLHEDKSEEADLVMMEIPEGSPDGQYVIQYSWNGYYDCTDVNVISELSTDFYGKRAAEIKYDKLDHCLWNPAYEDYEVLGDCKEIKRGESADSCFNDCNNLENCYGVQVVPFRLSNRLTSTGKKGSFKSFTSTMPGRCDTLTEVAEDSLVCFPLQQGKSVVGSTYDMSDDPFDPVFYGTCYIKGGAWEFDQKSPDAADVANADVFKFGGECISCNTMRNAEVIGRVPFWDITFDSCEHCDRSLG